MDSDVVGSGPSHDPAPDLMDISPERQPRVCVAPRSRSLDGQQCRLQQRARRHAGVGVIRVEQGGKRGELQAIALITHVVDGVERADPHSLLVRLLPKERHHGHSNGAVDAFFACLMDELPAAAKRKRR